MAFERRRAMLRRIFVLLICLLLLPCGARAALSVRMEGSAALLTAEGEVILPPGTYEDIVPLGEGLFAAGSGGLYALLDEAGQVRTEMVFSELQLADGLLLAQRDGKWGLLNRDGSERCPFEYTWILPSVSGNCWALRGNPNDLESDKLYRIDPDGRQHASRIYVRAVGSAGAEGMLGVLLPASGKYGYCDALGRLAIEARYEYAGSFIGGLAAVAENGCYGAIDRSGVSVIPAEYDFLEISGAGFVIASRRQEEALVFDLQGAEIARYEGEDIYIALVGEGYAVVDREFLSVYDAGGRMLLQAPGDSVALEGVGDQLIISEGAWGEECVYLNGGSRRWQNLYPFGSVGGEAIYACMTANVGRYMNDLLGEVQLSTDMDSARYGVTDSRGEPLLDCNYVSIELLGEDRLLARTEAQWQLIDIEGRVLWSFDAPMQTEEPSF